MTPWKKRPRTISDFNVPIDFDNGTVRQVQYSYDASGRPRMAKEIRNRVSSHAPLIRPISTPGTQANKQSLEDPSTHGDERDLEVELVVDDVPVSANDFPRMVMNRRDPNVRFHFPGLND
jgi:hypothetical protein